MRVSLEVDGASGLGLGEGHLQLELLGAPQDPEAQGPTPRDGVEGGVEVVDRADVGAAGGASGWAVGSQYWHRIYGSWRLNPVPEADLPAAIGQSLVHRGPA